MNIAAGSIPAPVAVIQVALSNSLSGHDQDQLGVFPPLSLCVIIKQPSTGDFFGCFSRHILFSGSFWMQKRSKDR